MKVLYVNMGGQLVAGSERSMLELIAEAGDRVEAHVLCNSAALGEAVAGLGHQATVTDLVEFSPYASPPWSLGSYWRGVQAAVSCAKGFRPDLIHANNIWPTQLAVAAGALARVPVVAHVRSLTLRSGRELSLMRLADHVIAISQCTAGVFRSMRLRRGRVTVVFDPVRVSGKSARSDRRGGPMRLAVAGRLSPEKAVHRTIDLLAWLRSHGLDATLTVLGDGPHRTRLEQLVARKDLAEVVQFAGFCDDLPGRLRQMDALLLSSLREGLGRVIVEAGMVGVPTIAVAVGGVPEIVHTEQTGLLVDDFESPRSREQILEVLHDLAALRGMGRRMQKFCREQFAPAKALEATMAVYRQVLRRRHRRAATRPTPIPAGRNRTPKPPKVADTP